MKIRPTIYTTNFPKKFKKKTVNFLSLEWKSTRKIQVKMVAGAESEKRKSPQSAAACPANVYTNTS